MGWLGAVKAFFAALSKIMGYVKDKQLLDAGEARGAAKANAEALEEAKKSRRARRNADPEREL